MSTVHVPILLRPIVEALLEPFRELPVDAEPHWIVDCTFGGGGHTGALLEALASDPKLSKHKVLSVDQDPEALARGQERFKEEIADGRLVLVRSRFSQADAHFAGKPVLGLMADLGFSSDQIDDAGRGLSFKASGPLDMRLDPTQGVSCRDYLAQIDEQELEEVIREYGEERFSRKIATAIVSARRQGKAPQTTADLENLVFHAVPPFARHGRIHPATRTFQALRIAVNGELEELDQLLGRVILSLNAGGRVAILSFHSLEDRKVKIAFKDPDLGFEPLTKKPIEADEEETARNPRSRSAKLRIARKL